MSTIISVQKRDGNSNNKQLRHLGHVPAVIYGKNLEASVPIKIEMTTAQKLLKEKGIGSQITLTLGDDSYDTMLKEIQSDPVSNKMLHLDFQVLTVGEKVSVQASLNFINKENVEAGGILQEMVTQLKYEALPKNLIEHIDVDLSGMKIGDSIKVKDLAIFNNDAYAISADPELDLILLSAARAESTGETEEDDTTVSPVLGE